MIYLYVLINGSAGQSDKAPTVADKKNVSDGELDVFRIKDGKFEVLNPSDYLWVPADKFVIDPEYNYHRAE